MTIYFLRYSQEAVELSLPACPIAQVCWSERYSEKSEKWGEKSEKSVVDNAKHSTRRADLHNATVKESQSCICDTKNRILHGTFEHFLA